MRPPPSATSGLKRLALAVRSRRSTAVLAALPQLRVLHVHLGLPAHITGANVGALATMTQLEMLELSEGDGSRVADDDLADMLRPLRRLRVLVLQVSCCTMWPQRYIP
jgi:hypothetical protein